MSSAAALAIASPNLVQAASDSYRNKPVNSIIPFNAGSEFDVWHASSRPCRKSSPKKTTDVPFN